MSLRVPGSTLREFIDQIEFTDECWYWTREPKRRYGRFRVNGIRDYAHRWSYRFWVGKLKDGFDIHHLCDNTRCVNPDHLVQISTKEHKRLHSLGEDEGRQCPQCGKMIVGDNAAIANDRRLPRCRNCLRRVSKDYEKRWRGVRRIG